MKNFVSTIILFFVFLATIQAQERIDVVYLKNGDIIKGIIIENVPNDYVRVELMGGSVLTYKYVDIIKFTKEINQQIILEKPEKKEQPTIIMQQQQQQQQQQPITTPSTQPNSTLSEAQKLALYEDGKKTPGAAIVLSLLLSSTGHAYAGNWGRGLLFLGGRVLAFYTFASMESEDGPLIGFLISLGIGIWEAVDAGQEVERYNKRLYNRINLGIPDLSFDFIPIREGIGLNFKYAL